MDPKDIQIRDLQRENARLRKALEAMQPHVDKIARCIPLNDEMGRVVVGQTEAAKSLKEIFDDVFGGSNA